MLNCCLLATKSYVSLHMYLAINTYHGNRLDAQDCSCTGLSPLGRRRKSLGLLCIHRRRLLDTGRVCGSLYLTPSPRLSEAVSTMYNSWKLSADGLQELAEGAQKDLVAWDCLYAPSASSQLVAESFLYLLYLQAKWKATGTQERLWIWMQGLLPKLGSIP